MKRYFITLTLLCLTAISYGQTIVGVKGNDPFLTFNAFTNVKSNESYNMEIFAEGLLPNVGVFVNVPFSSHFGFQAEFMYKQEIISFQKRGENLDKKDRQFIRFGSIEVPLLLHIQGNNPFRGFGQIGVAPKFLLNATYSEKQRSDRENISRYFNSTQLTFHIGGGVMWNSPKWVFMIDGRFSGTLTAISNETHSPFLNFKDADSVYVTFSVGVGYKIR